MHLSLKSLEIYYDFVEYFCHPLKKNSQIFHPNNHLLRYFVVEFKPFQILSLIHPFGLDLLVNVLINL